MPSSARKVYRMTIRSSNKKSLMMSETPPKSRTCAFRDPETGERHGIELTEENSYKGSRYCKPHHNQMMIESRRKEGAREAHNARVNEWQRKHPEVNLRTQHAHRKRAAAGIKLETRRGRPPKNPSVEWEPDPALVAAIAAGPVLSEVEGPALPPPVLSEVEGPPFADVAERGEGWAPVKGSPRRHWFNARGYSLCTNWRSGGGAVNPDEPRSAEHCAGCIRALERRRSTKEKQAKKL